jgi:hypothetical protein
LYRCVGSRPLILEGDCFELNSAFMISFSRNRLLLQVSSSSLLGQVLAHLRFLLVEKSQ